MSRTFEDAQEARMAQYIARHLGIRPSALVDHPYEIDEVTTNDGAPVAWRLSWTDAPPPGVNAQGGPAEWWNDIPIGDIANTSVSAAAVLSVIASAMTPKMRAALSSSSQGDPVSRQDMLSVGHEATRFMHHIVSALMAMEGHNLDSFEKLSQSASVIDDFAAAVLHASHWNLNPQMDDEGE